MVSSVSDRTIFFLAGNLAIERRFGAASSWHGKAVSTVSTAIDVGGIGRSIASAAIGERHLAITYSGVAAGSLWGGLGVHELASGVRDYLTSRKIGDQEGGHRAGARMASGLFLTSGSALHLTGQTIKAAGLVVPAALGVGLSLGAESVFGIGSILTMGVVDGGLFAASNLESAWTKDC